jgi:UDP-N-acetylmuramyl pentapeptide phosphotransferase/UDP-N-acetylglucosamine-1-phosphate transferase
VLRVLAERHGLLDRPNDRSLHTKPVPRLGGVGIVLGASCATAAILALGPTANGEILTLLVSALVLAAIGLADDLRGLRASTRFFLQIAVAAAYALRVGVPTRLELVPDVSITLPYAGALVLWTVFIVGSLNIYNFMDGMDGLAALQAIGASLGLAAVFAAGDDGASAMVPLVLACASFGFFVHNAPPAKIFMGDAGSTFVGFTFAGLALIGATRARPVSALTVPLALAPFLLDGTFTILRRLSKGEKIWKAHRSHLYQRAVATGLSHHDVLLPYAAWIACSAVGAVVADGGRIGAALSVSTAVGGLALVIAWVRRLERAASDRASVRTP